MSSFGSVIGEQEEKNKTAGQKITHWGYIFKKKGTPSFSFRCQDIIKIKWSLGGFKIRYIKREVIYKM